MSAVKRKFSTPDEALRWLRKIQPLFPVWKDNTGKTAWLIAIRTTYPIALRLPQHAVFVGLDTIETAIKPALFTNPDPAAFTHFAKLLDLADTLELQAEGRRPGAKKNDYAFIAYGSAKGRRRIRYYPDRAPAGTPPLEHLKQTYTQLCSALGIKGRFTVVGDRLTCVPPKRVEFDGFSYDDKGNCYSLGIQFDEETPGEAFVRLAGFIRDNGLKITHPQIFGALKGPTFPVSKKSAQQIRLLNAAALPIKKLSTEMWVTIDSWKNLPTMAELAAMDNERSTFELTIVSIKLGPKLDGEIGARLSKKGCEISISPAHAEPAGSALFIGSKVIEVPTAARVDEEAFGRKLRELKLPERLTTQPTSARKPCSISSR